LKDHPRSTPQESIDIVYNNARETTFFTKKLKCYFLPLNKDENIVTDQ
jgi:hypothetical protein